MADQSKNLFFMLVAFSKLIGGASKGGERHEQSRSELLKLPEIREALDRIHLRRKSGPPNHQ
ncbi:MAG: hypothetical protein JJU18_06700 [Oceanicaulis sp.]|nr:hypothetical protein [Oceanicaulis sp.]